MKRYVGKRNIGLLFVLLQTILYVAFLTLDLGGDKIGLSSKIKFTMIILCFCYAFFGKKNAGRSIIFYLQAALFLTVISDLFILILDYYFYGVLTFILVQQLYGYRLILGKEYYNCNESDRVLRTFLLRFIIQLAIAFIVCFVLFNSGIRLEELFLATVFYFISLIFNVVSSIKIALIDLKNKGNLLFAVGMVLFLFCDINVGLFNLSGFVTLPKDLYELIYFFSSILMWTFYAPSQVLIALSVKISLKEPKLL
ncbi:MAG: lysoplasmalogenase family protein [Mobilitalea sp.]